MDVDVDQPVIRGRELRYLLTMQLLESTEVSLDELISGVAASGFALDGRPSKAVSDALRWEDARGRARRVRRGVYQRGSMPRSTYYWIRSQVRALQQPGAVPRGW